MTNETKDNLVTAGVITFLLWVVFLFFYFFLPYAQRGMDWFCIHAPVWVKVTTTGSLITVAFFFFTFAALSAINGQHDGRG